MLGSLFIVWSISIMSTRPFLRVSCLLGLALVFAAPAAFAQTACTLTCSANITTSTPPGGSQVVVTYPAPTTSAGCSGAPVQTAGLPSGAAFPIGQTTNCFSAPGPVANGTCCFNVTVTGTPLQLVQVPTGTPAAWWTLAVLMLAAGGFAATRWSR
jgi:hypothetical protein